MKHVIKFDGKIIAELTTNHSMTNEEICEACGIEIAITQEDFEGLPENGMYDIDDLEIL